MVQIKKVENKYAEASHCPIGATIGVIGGKWKPIIIWLLMQKPKRFGELHRSIPGVSLKVLTRHLRELEKDGIIKREVYPEVPQKVEYSLSEKGKTLQYIMEQLASWSRENIPDQINKQGF